MPERISRRPVRSFVLRQGRMTRGQQRAMEELWPIYGLDGDREGPLNPESAFGRIAPLVLEIGFGDGGALLDIALKNPGTNFLGVEVHRPGVGSLMLKLEQAGINNVRVFRHDAVEVLQHCIPPASLDRLHLFFPDPWPKKKHHKRRIVSDRFIALVCQRLSPSGIFHFASDWQEYAEDALARLNAVDQLRNLDPAGGFSPRPDWRPVTKFERRGRKLGHGVWDLQFALETQPCPAPA